MDSINSGIFNIIFPIKPDGISTAEKDKDDVYSAQYGRWCVGNGFNVFERVDHMNRIEINRNFYGANKQWSFDEDINVFLRDSNMNETNRIKVEMNMVQIMGNQYIGNVKNMNFTARATSFSPLVKTRKEDKLVEMLYWTSIAQNSTPDFAQYIKKKFPIGQDEDETQAIFENVYVDHSIKAINGLLRYSEVVNKFDERKKFLTEQLFLTGAAIMKPYIANGEYLFKPILTERFFFDRTAIEYDLADADYMGDWDYLLSTDIYERYDLEEESKQKLEEFIRSRSIIGTYNNKIATFNVCWRDCVKTDYGYVKDEQGNVGLERINFTHEFEEKPRYTDDDCINLSECTPWQLDVLGKKKTAKGKAKKSVTADQWRYCTFIPAEILGLPVIAENKSRQADIVLDYGILPFQENDIYNSLNIVPPYKVNFYILEHGDVYSPVDIVINPQRIANRVMSVFENIINNSGASGFVYDKDMVEDEEELMRNVKEGKPVGIRTKGMGIPNATGKYDNTPSTGATNLSNIAQIFLSTIEKISGINDTMKGQNNNSQALVGVTQLMLERGSVIQQRFYESLEQLYKSCYQAIATSGKRLYCEQKKKLINIVGDSDTEIITIDPEMKLEDIRVSIKRVANPESERQNIDQQLLPMFMQLGLLDQLTFANLVGRASMDDMFEAIRKFAKIKDEQQRQAAAVQSQMAQQQQAAQQQQMQQAQGQQNAMVQNDNINKEKDRQAKLDDTLLKGHFQAQQSAMNTAQNVGQ